MTGEQWSSRLGFVLATVGAAVGLGNIWRFPAVLGTNGGGAYLVPYVLAALLCAVPLLVLELSVGRTLRTDVVSAFRHANAEYAALGWLVAGGVVLILSYYLVLTAWVLGFLLQWLVGSPASFAAFTATWQPVGLFVVVTAITGTVVSLGVRGGIERMATVVMPTVFVVLVCLALYALTFAGWGQAAAFLFTPDFSVLGDPGLWSAAVGQVFFSLSVGQGIMLTYGAYVDRETPLVRTSLLITVVDVGAALLAGLVIFPIVFTFGLEPTLGTELAFTTLPTAFASMPFGRVIAVAFFGLLFFAALSSAVALLEVGVAAGTNATRLSRTQATRVLTLGVFVLGIPSALSYSPIALEVLGAPVLDLVDESVGTYALPLSALAILVTFVWATDLLEVRRDLGRLYPLVRYLIPVVLVVVLLAKVGGVPPTAWRLLVDTTHHGSVGAVLAVGLSIVLVALGWTLRERFRGRRSDGRRRP